MNINRFVFCPTYSKEISWAEDEHTNIMRYLRRPCRKNSSRHLNGVREDPAVVNIPFKSGSKSIQHCPRIDVFSSLDFLSLGNTSATITSFGEREC